MDVVIGVVLVVLGAAGASAIARTVGARVRGPLLGLAVAPAGVLVGTGAAFVRGWDVLASAVVAALVLGLLAAGTGLRWQPRNRRTRS